MKEGLGIEIREGVEVRKDGAGTGAGVMRVG